MKPITTLMCAVLLMASLVCATARAAHPAAPEHFRDVQIYTTSAPNPANPSHIVATMKLLNRGRWPLDVHVVLDEQKDAGFAGARLDWELETDRDVDWKFDLIPPDGFRRAVLKGTITFGDKSAQPARELYVAVQGPDAAEFNDPLVQKITARAEVVGTHTQLTHETLEQQEKHEDQYKPPGPGGPPALVVAAAGKTDYQIVISPESLQLADALADLKRAVKFATDADLPVANDGAGRAIRIKLIPPIERKHPETYHLCATGTDIVIESPTVEGLRHGIYGLLTDHLDCHWFMPKRLGEEFPRPADRALRMPRIEETRSPSFFSSFGMSWSSAPKWDQQNRSRINRGRMVFGHAWAGLIDKVKYPYDKFPDMWSRDASGKIQQFDSNWSATNFCSTSPEVIQIVAEKINAQFDANPDAIVQSIDPNDLSPMCQCPRCLALDQSLGVKPTDDKQMADRLMQFSKEIYDRLKPEHKEKFLGILAYGFQTRPPKAPAVYDHHATIVCDFPNYFDHTRPFNDPSSSYNRDFAGIVNGWGEKVKQLGFYDYYGHYNFFGPWGVIHKMREDLPAFREMGGTFVVIEAQPNFSMHGLNLYIASRLAWDVNADVDLLVNEYLTKFFGPAANSMREFFDATERTYALTRPGIEAALRVGRQPEFWQELDGYLAGAEKAVQGADKRFVDRVAFMRDGFNLGKRMFDLKSREKDAAFLRESKTELDRLKAKYPESDPYWPTVMATYFWPDVDAMLKAAQ